MNVMSLLNQLMQQARSAQGGPCGSVGNPSGSPATVGGSGMNIDVKSLIGGGTLGLMLGSKRGRKLGGKALKYGALAGVGALAWKAYQDHQVNSRSGEPQAVTSQPVPSRPALSQSASSPLAASADSPGGPPRGPVSAARLRLVEPGRFIFMTVVRLEPGEECTSP